MSDDDRSTLDQLEDALLKFLPAAGGVVGGLLAAGALSKTKIPPLVAFVAGGAGGGLIAFVVFKFLFRVINPGRDRDS